MVVKLCVREQMKMAQKLSIQDKKDLDKFTKFLALKATQIIVQSRLGEKVSTPCKPQTAGADWVRSVFTLEYFLVPVTFIKMCCLKTA